MIYSSSREGAEKKHRQSITDLTGKMCPVYRMKCQGERCVAFFPGYVYKESGDTHSAKEAECTSPLVTGVILHSDV